MPKERFHLLLIDQYLSRQSIAGAGRVPLDSLAMDIGAISPDIFFYDFPFFHLNSFGNSLHALMARNGISPILDWLASSPVDTKAKSWALGFACHFLADASWHPFIDDLSGNLAFCKGKGLPPGDCHLFLESEMEGFWLPKLGSPGGYVDLLHTFQKDRRRLGSIASIYRQFLAYVGLRPPSKGRIVRCFHSQNFMLRLFACKVLGKRRDLLLAMRPSRYLASLTVPARPVLPSNRLPENRAALKLFDNDFTQSKLSSLFSLLADFEEQLP